jgi:hypothetical protein
MLYFMPVGRVEEEEQEEAEEDFRELHGGTNVLRTSRPGWFDIAAIRVVSTIILRRRL